MQVCEAKTRSPCRLYAVNGAMVWAKDAGLVSDSSNVPTPHDRQPGGGKNATIV